MSRRHVHCDPDNMVIGKQLSLDLEVAPEQRPFDEEQAGGEVPQ